jgi:outer membrane protein OmpA-like peptidoglycan-associated protein
MGRAVASSSRPRFAALAALCAFLSLAGCIGTTVFDDLNSMEPVGGPFNEALFKNYSYLARSFGTESSPMGQAFDSEGAISLTGSDNTIQGLANLYAQKALSAGRGEDVLPEPAAESDADAENVRLELLRDLDEGRDKAPEDAARAQADYDCWIMNRRVEELKTAALACRRSVTVSLAKLEHDLNPTPTAAPTTSSSLPPPPAPVAQPVQFTITFPYRSARLTSDQLSIITEAISAARNGHQAHITVVGHTDTDEDSRELSLHRADAVEAALVQQGARREAIAASGVGKDDLAVQTDDHVKEPKNRRVVITLVP